jgi:Clp amino terminal domain, pathogenicity island component
MFDRQELCARRCVRTLIEIIEQLPARWATRAPMVLDESSVGMLLLWTFIRWERRFPLTALEEMGLDIWAFTRAVDQLLEHEKIKISETNYLEPAKGANDPNSIVLLRELTNRWLERAEEEARSMGHTFLGAEHLLLALAAGADASWSPLFARYGIDHERLKNTVLAALSSNPGHLLERAIDAILLPPANEEKYSTRYAVPWGASWDNKPAVGVPRKFSMAVLMMMVTLFAVMFSILRWFGALPVFYGVFGLLVFGVTMGQMVLFGGKYPRAASIWSGAVLLPLEIGAINLFSNLISVYYNIAERVFITCFYMLLTVPVGALFGYLAGGVTAGVVLLLEWKKEQDPLPADTTDV